MASDLASITSKEHKLGIRDKLSALKHRTALAAGEPTGPEFEDSFGDQLSDLNGRHRWILAGLAQQKWHQDLRDRVGEVVRENEGEIYKGRSIRGTATLQHCWMMGYGRSYAQPTVIISCDQTTILKRTMRAISQHGVLKAAKFALKGIPFCDLKLRTEPGGEDARKDDCFLDNPGTSHQTSAGEDSIGSQTNVQPANMSSNSILSGGSSTRSHGNGRDTDRSLHVEDKEDSARERHDVEVRPKPASSALQHENQHPGQEVQANEYSEGSPSPFYTKERLPMDQKTDYSQDGARKESDLREIERNLGADIEDYQEKLKERKKREHGRQDESRVKFGPTRTSEERKLVPYDLDSSDDDELPLRFGAEEIIVPHSGRSTTLGGFLMVDDICFGLTAAHAFTGEGQDLEQQMLGEMETTVQLYGSDWANENSDEADENDSVLNSNVIQKAKEQRLQRTRKRNSINKHTYESSRGEAFQITAKSRLLSANGLDWALCDLGDWGKFSLNGTNLPMELRGDDGLEYLLFKQIKSSPPLGKVLVATKRGVVPGLGTGSDCSIKLGKADRYQHVWSIQVEESLTSGDSGSWVVDAVTGDVYGIVVAGSTALCEEYVIPAFEIGQDICRVMRAEHVRLPTLQDVMAARTEQLTSRDFTRDSTTDALGWESVDSGDTPDEKPLDEKEKRFLLAEVLKTSSIDTNVLAKVIKDAEIRPRWTEMSLPKRRSLRMAQRAVDRLLSDSWPKEEVTEDQWAFTRPGLQRHRETSYIREVSASTKASAEVQGGNGKSDDDKDTPPFEEPPELLDSNPSFRAEMSRRAWRAKRRAEQGPSTKAHHRKHRPRKRSGEVPHADPILRAPGSSEKAVTKDQSKLEGDLADKQGRDDPDVLVLKHKGSTYIFKFPPSSIADGSLLVGDLRQQAAKEFGVDDPSRVSLVYRGKSLKYDTRVCREEGLRFRSEVLCVIKRTAFEELEFLANKFRTELVPQGLEFISDTPDEAKQRDFEYNKISETILTQILMKSDAVDIEGDKNAQRMRKALTQEAQGFLDVLDSAAKKDSPAAWHADFIEQKNETGSRPVRPSFSNKQSSGSKLRRSSTRDGNDPEDLALSDDEVST